MRVPRKKERQKKANKGGRTARKKDTLFSTRAGLSLSFEIFCLRVSHTLLKKTVFLAADNGAHLVRFAQKRKIRFFFRASPNKSAVLIFYCVSIFSVQNSTIQFVNYLPQITRFVLSSRVIGEAPWFIIPS